MRKRLFFALLTLTMLFQFILQTLASEVGATATINIGDYVEMGKYYGEDILWRCVDIDQNGPLMLADRIIALKPFDAIGSHKYLDGTAQNDSTMENSRTTIGSNIWETSSIRAWLNSAAFEGNVQWLDGCPPEADKVYNGYNAYATEKGFLAQENFTKIERNAIQSVTQKSLLNELDVPKLSIGGSAIYKRDSDISKVVQNYDTAFYQNVTDDIFLLDVLQINKVYQNSAALGSDYYIGKPTQKAVDNSEFKNSELAANRNWHSFLRTPSTSSRLSSYLCTVYADGTINDCIAAKNLAIGVRPAFYMNLKSVIFTSGTGKIENPLILSAGEESTSSSLSSVTSQISSKPSSNNSSTSTSGTTSSIEVASSSLDSVASQISSNPSLNSSGTSTSGTTSSIEVVGNSSITNVSAPASKINTSSQDTSSKYKTISISGKIFTAISPVDPNQPYGQKNPTDPNDPNVFNRYFAQIIIELHSSIKTTKTDNNGYYKFVEVEFGEHTLYAKDDKGIEIAKLPLVISFGSDTKQTSDGIMVNGDVVMLDLTLSGDKLAIKSLSSTKSNAISRMLPFIFLALLFVGAGLFIMIIYLRKEKSKKYFIEK